CERAHRRSSAPRRPKRRALFGAMKNAPSTLLVSVTDSTVFVKISGRAVFTSSVQLKNLVHELTSRGYKHFVMDLTDCVVMDSTFLGVLARSGSTLHAGEGSSTN